MVRVLIDEVLDDAGGLTHASLPSDHRAAAHKGVLTHQIPPKWTMGLPHHLATQFKEL
jgi:hypothetical protein